MTNNVLRVGFHGRSPVSIGRFTYGFENISIRQWGEGASLRIGSFCSIASDITIFLGGNHRVDWATTFPFGHIFQDELGGGGLGHPTTNGDVNIGDDVWIGSGVTIMSGVSIGSGAVLAANSNVVNDVLPYEIVGGNPARLIRKRFDDDVVELLLKLKWWDLSLDDIKVISRRLCNVPTKDSLLELIKKYGN